MERYSAVLLIAVGLLVTGPVAAQAPGGSALPRLLRFSGTAIDAGGKPVTGIAGITFALYGEQSGGTPLWSETQSVPTGGGGRYTILLGATQSGGLPADLFIAEQAHWVGVSVEGQAEQPRVLLVSAPYALKAGDAETLGGLPPSAFLLAATPGGHPESANGSPPSVSTSTGLPTLAGNGTAGYIPLWTDSNGDLGNSAVFQSGSGSTAKIGINTAKPKATLDVKGSVNIGGLLSLPATGTATASNGFNSQAIGLAASVFNSITSTPVTQTFQWQVEPVGNNTSAAGASLNLLYGFGTSTPAETGLHIAGNGQIAFASGQTFPGAGTITGVTAGNGLTGGGATGNITLNLDPTKVPQLSANNTFTANQTVNGSVTATSFSGSGASVTNVNASQFGGLAPSAYAQLAAGNTFSGTQIMAGTNSSGVLQVTNTVASGKGAAIVGTTNSSAANAVKGIVTATSGTDAGIFGATSSTAGYGVYGQGPNVGVYGSASGPSIGCASCGSAGVWGDSGSAAPFFTGVLGSADANSGGVFVNNSNYVATLLVENRISNGMAPAFETYSINYGGKGCIINVSGSLDCDGTLDATVPAGAQKVTVYAMQAAENWIEDAGSGQLSGGSARIVFDPTFAQTVNTSVEYNVFLTPKGDCEGLYVGNQTPQGFEVHELRSGHSNVAFAYRIMAKRAGYETLRLTDVTQKYEATRQQSQKLNDRMRLPGAPGHN